MELIIATSDHSFKFKNENYKIKTAGITKGIPYAEVEPHSDELVKEICKRLLKDNGLVVYLANGYTCFTEDYLNI